VVTGRASTTLIERAAASIVAGRIDLEDVESGRLLLLVHGYLRVVHALSSAAIHRFKNNPE